MNNLQKKQLVNELGMMEICLRGNRIPEFEDRLVKFVNHYTKIKEYSNQEKEKGGL